MAKNNIKETKSTEELLQEALIPVEEQPYKIPDNWVWTKTATINEVITGNTPPKNDLENYGNYFLFVKPDDLNQGRDLNTSKEMLSEKGSKISRIVPKNSTLICCIGSIGKSAFSLVDCVTNQQINSLVPRINIAKPLFVYYNSLTSYYQKLLIDNSSATTISIINKTKVSELPITLPPLPEQQRIVEKLESMLGKIKQAKELIEEAKETFKNRRASILAKAFSGELTEKWREENQNVMTAEELLEIIKNRRFTEAKKFEQIEEIYAYDEKENFGTLPNTWRLVTLEKVCESFKYGTSSKSENEGLIPVIRMGNLQNGKIDWNNLVYTSDKNEIEKYSLSKDDVLFNRTNSPELVGKTSIYKGEMPAIYAGYLIKILNYPELNSDFLNFFLNSHIAKHYCWNVKTDGVSQSNINAQKLAKFEIPLAPIEEQKEIVRIVENLLSKENEALEKIESMEDHLSLLEKSILSKAFRGELGTNNPDEESAINLLKEILEKTENESTTKKSVKKKEVANVMSKKESLKDIISEKFTSKEFTFDELREYTSNT